MILLLGGTLESRQLAEVINAHNYSFIISTTSEYGGCLAKEVCENVNNLPLEQDALENFCMEKNIKIIIDATHPYAKNISDCAINISKNNNIKYLRYERQGLIDFNNNPYVHLVASYMEASLLASQLGNKILLTTGSRKLEIFHELIKTKEVYARILPDINSLKKCLDLGLLPRNIIAMQGPFTKEFNKTLFIEKGIEVVITKNSGDIGGVDTKLEACSELKIPLIIIDKPSVEYPRVAYNFASVLHFIKEVQNEL
ncbi:MAG: hypothetical protein JM58_02735 [Peptococcaceae bacterium BICA1-8]|nr:MAG: hypothetical protein JM58_02735 [Peptococcaceae bacterium BICA1-8]